MIKEFLLNILLTFLWVALTGHLNFANIGFGFVLGFFVLWIKERTGNDKRYFFRVPKIIGFIFFYFMEMIKANLQVAYDVVTPHYFMKPGIVGLPLDAKTDFEITMLSNMISLTPGTLVVDLSSDRKVMFVHVMYLKSREEFIKTTKEGLEKKLLEILR
jgi:multicomponent Na+:H+ antiporter subunit E